MLFNHVIPGWETVNVRREMFGERQVPDKPADRTNEIAAIFTFSMSALSPIHNWGAKS
jgi:hypothetical protein